VSIFAFCRGKASVNKPVHHLFDTNLWIKFTLDNKSFAPALGGACGMGTNTMALIQTC